MSAINRNLILARGFIPRCRISLMPQASTMVIKAKRIAGSGGAHRSKYFRADDCANADERPIESTKRALQSELWPTD